MELGKLIALSVVFSLLALLIIFSIVYTRKTSRAIKESQSDITDKALLEFINSQPDKIVNVQMLIQEFGLTKFQAGSRLRSLSHYGVLKRMHTRNGMKAFYTLGRPIDKPYDLKLTDDPFMTVEDLMVIFEHYEYQVTLQELCLVTGLPIKVLIEEMKYFEKEKIVNYLLMTNSSGVTHSRVFTLREPYRSNPREYMSLVNANYELKEIYQKTRPA